MVNKYTDFHDILKTFQEESDNETPVRTSDEQLITAAISQENDPEYDARNQAYTELLKVYIDDYVKKSKSKKNYKFWFFVVSLAAFGFIVLTAIVSIWIVTIRGNISLGDVGVVVSALTGMISAFIVIPKIIAEHLFPADKDIFSPKETLDCSTINFRWLYCSSEICECLIMSDSSCLFVGNGVNVIQTSFLGGRT